MSCLQTNTGCFSVSIVNFNYFVESAHVDVSYIECRGRPRERFPGRGAEEGLLENHTLRCTTLSRRVCKPSQFIFHEQASVSWIALPHTSDSLKELPSPKVPVYFGVLFAESVGFEPTVPFGTLVFKTSAIVHSANLPDRGKERYRAPKEFHPTRSHPPGLD